MLGTRIPDAMFRMMLNTTRNFFSIEFVYRILANYQFRILTWAQRHYLLSCSIYARNKPIQTTWALRLSVPFFHLCE